MIPGQMSIFDLMPEEDLEQIPIEDTVNRIGSAIGVVFKYNAFFDQYRAEVGQSVLKVDYDRYNTLDERNNKRFIGCGIDDKRNHCGSGCPCDSIKEAIGWFEKKRRTK